MLIRTPEELVAARKKINEEYDRLPSRSMFGTDNVAARKLQNATFDKIEQGEHISSLIDDYYDRIDYSPELEDAYRNAIHLLYWAMGEEDEP